MTRLCRTCGAALSAGIPYCANCGTPSEGDGTDALESTPVDSDHAVDANRPPSVQPYPYQVPLRPGPGPTHSGLALASLIVGIVTLPLLLVCPIGFATSIVAIVLGHVARRQIRQSNGAKIGSGMALAGLITGYATLALGVAIFVALAIVFGYAG